jgi:hypothetical protein
LYPKGKQQTMTDPTPKPTPTRGKPKGSKSPGSGRRSRADGDTGNWVGKQASPQTAERGKKDLTLRPSKRVRDLIREYADREGISQTAFVERVVELYHTTPKIL